VPELDVCPVEELPPGEMKIVTAGLVSVGVYNLDGAYYAIETAAPTTTDRSARASSSPRPAW
jgi:nitrite reductase/ring-hydroxylating ferredoxin subunit